MSTRTRKPKRTPKSTGKWRVPKYDDDTLTLTVVKDFFQTFTAEYGDVNVQDVGDAFLVYLDQCFRLPSQDTCFINGTPLQQWVIADYDYWRMLCKGNAQFAEATRCEPDSVIQLVLVNGLRIYSYYNPEWPRENGVRVFNRQMAQLMPRSVVVQLPHTYYHQYLHALVLTHDVETMPIIRSTEVDDASHTLRIVLHYADAAWVVCCIPFHNVGVMTFFFYA